MPALASCALIDLHAHLLPGIDDGPADEAGSVALAEAAVRDGIAAMAATPHIDHRHGVRVGELADRLARLRARLAAADVPLEVHKGGELALARFDDLVPEELEAITLGRGPYLLLECPFTTAGPLLERAVFRAQSLGFGVLLAHPERSPDMVVDPRRVAGLVERGVLVQITAGSLTGRFGRTVRREAFRLIADGLVHAIASDAHDTTTRPPDIGGALDHVGELLDGAREWAPYWTQVVPQAVLAGAAIDPSPRLRLRRRRGFSRWRARSRGRG